MTLILNRERMPTSIYDPYGEVMPVWKIDVQGHGSLAWDRFGTGPLVLSDGDLARLSQRLIQLPLDEVGKVAGIEIGCYVSGDVPAPSYILLHSATSTTKGFEGDVHDLVLGHEPWDVASYLETRSVFLAQPGDLAVGRLPCWQDAVRHAGLEFVDIHERDYYYLSHALLVMAEQFADAESSPLRGLIRRLQEQPGSVIRLYALDRETQIFLLWLKRVAGVERLWVDVNNPTVSSRWNSKGHMHPTVEATLSLDSKLSCRDCYEKLHLEQRQSELYKRLGVIINVLPGYTLERQGVSDSRFVAELHTAARLLRDRYGLTKGCLKPSEAGDGARIVAPIDLFDDNALTSAAADAYPNGDDYLLEAYVDFCTFKVGNREFIQAPSGHIRFGHVAEGLTMQFMRGRTWEGNVYFDEATCPSLNVSPEQYQTMRRGLNTIRDAFFSEASRTDGSYAGLVTGGIDFAIGRIGGEFEDDILIAATDFNLSSHGAEYLRAFLEKAKKHSNIRYAASRVFRPTEKGTLETLIAALRKGIHGDLACEVVASVPQRWGMIVVTGRDPLEAGETVLQVLEQLTVCGLSR